MFSSRNRLGSLTGFTLNTYEQAQVIQLENDIEDLRAELECKNLELQLLDEQLEVSKAQLDAQNVLAEDKIGQLKNEIENGKSKAIILEKYFECMTNEDMLINKQRREVDNFNTQFWLKLKPIMDNYRAVLEDTQKLKEVHQKCVELQQKAHCLMAPSH